MSLYDDLKKLLAQAETDLATDPAISTDLECIAADLWAMLGRHSPLAAEAKPQALFNSLPILGRLRLSARDKAELDAFAADCREKLTAAGVVGKVNWCNVVAAMNATIAALVAAGVPVPAYLTLVASILGSLCPTADLD